MAQRSRRITPTGTLWLVAMAWISCPDAFTADVMYMTRPLRTVWIHHDNSSSLQKTGGKMIIKIDRLLLTNHSQLYNCAIFCLLFIDHLLKNVWFKTADVLFCFLATLHVSSRVFFLTEKPPGPFFFWLQRWNDNYAAMWRCLSSRWGRRGGKWRDRVDEWGVGGWMGGK